MIFKKPARKVTRVFIHCSASDNPAHDGITVIDQWHRERGWSEVGYHFYIKKDGIIQEGRSIEKTPAAQKGHNTGSIAICLGGLHKFTGNQLSSLHSLCKDIQKALPQVTFWGHRDVDPNKTCPNFDVRQILKLDRFRRIV